MDTALPSSAFAPSGRVAFGLPGDIRLGYAAQSALPEDAGRRIAETCRGVLDG